MKTLNFKKSLKSSSFILLKVIICSLIYGGGVFATTSEESPLSVEEESYQIAQSDETDAYDPFADYSDFSESESEEADINFFRNGRFYTFGAMLGRTQYTGTYGDHMDPGLNFGIFLNYFFDLRFAVQFTFYSSSHDFKLTTPTTQSEIRQNTKLTSMNVDVKYYFNTQNVTKGLANLSPYALVGFTQVSQAAVIDIRTAKSTSSGFNLGAGIEIPIMRNAMYVGAQLGYQFVQFKGEGEEVVYNEVEPTGIFLTGDLLNIHAVMGVNF